MPYYIRLLTPSREQLALQKVIEACANSQKRKLRVVREESAFTVLYADDEMDDDENDAIVIIERLPIEPGSEGEGELDEFGEEVGACKPISAVAWLLQYFRKVKQIYRFQILEPTREDWELIHAIQGSLHESLRGITQADMEGFSNENGDHILWQFSDHVSGSWDMAVLNDAGNWIPFEMDLGNQDHRRAFLQGLVPAGVELL